MLKPILIFCCFIAVLNLTAQKTYSLQECIDLAIKNSATTRQAELQHNDATLDVTQAKNARYPSIDAGVGHGLNFGRSIDPSTNDFINERITRGGFTGGISLPLWQAGRITHSMKSAQYSEEAARWALKNVEDNLKLQVTLAYLQILNNKELSVRAEQQQVTSSEQAKRLENLAKQGAVLPSQVSDMQGQLATDQVNTLDANQAVKNAKLVLTQIMNIPFDESMEVQPISDLAQSRSFELSDLTATKSNHALIKISQFQQKSAEATIAGYKAQRFPRLSIGADLGSNYSSAYTLNGDKIGYGKQLSNNFNYSSYLSLSIPIFNAYSPSIRTNRAKASNALKLAQVNTELAQNTIQQKIEEALLLLKNAEERYSLVETQVKAFAESFRIAESRFNEGVLNSVEYIIAKNNLDRAQNQLISSKYEVAFRNKIIEFYGAMGK